MICKADNVRTFLWCVALGALFSPVTDAQTGVREGEAIIYVQGADKVVHCGGISVGDCQIATDISAAQELISGYRNTAKLRTGQPLKTLRVIFPAGVYRLRSAIEIDGWGKVPDGPSIVLQGAGRESSRLAGTVEVPRSQWRSLSPNDTRWNANTRMQIKVVDYKDATGRSLTAMFPTEKFGAKLQPVPLFVTLDDQPMVLARWPNNGYATIESVKTTGGVSAITFVDNSLHMLPTAGAILAGYLYNDWAYERVPVTASNDGKSIVQFRGTDSAFGARAGQRAFIENSMAEFDSPGEWIYDQTTQELFFWPQDGSDHAVPGGALEIAIANQLIHINNSSNVRIEHLALDGSLDGAISIDNGESVLIDDVSIRNVANRAVTILGGHNVTVSNCLIEDTGAGGVYAYGGDRSSLRPGMHTIRGCEIRRFGQRIKSYQPAIRIEGVGNSTIDNRIYDSPHVGIMFSGNDQMIAGNNISAVLKETNDAGAIYTGQDWAARGTVVSNNFIHDIPGYLGAASQVVGIYLDDQASGIAVVDNIVANVSVGMLLGGGRDNDIERNIFVHNRVGIFTDARGLTWQKVQTQDHGGVFWQNLNHVPFSGDTYRAKYPHLANLPSDSPGTPKYNVIRWNVLIDGSGIDDIDPIYVRTEAESNVSLGVDALVGGKAALSSQLPEGFDILKEQLPPSWRPITYPARGDIPR